MAAEDNRRATIISGGIAWVTRVLQAAISLGAAVVLARMLSPDAFGVFAMVVPLGVLANQLAGQAVQTALLQRQDLGTEETNQFFWFAVRTNLVIATAMVAVGFLLAAFYREPRVPAVVIVWAAMTWLLTITTFQEALLKRALRFPVVMLTQLLALAVAVGCAILAAAVGAGYWALPVQLIVMEGVRAVGVAHASRWVPKLSKTPTAQVAFLRDAWRDLVGYRLAAWVGEQPELLAVGRIGGATPLGLYDTARRWAWYPFEEPYTILTDVAVAGARVAGDAEAVKRFLAHSILATLTASLPVIAFAGVSAPDLVPVLLGKQWLSAVPLLRALCVMAFAGALARVAFWLPLSCGTPGVLLRWSALVHAPVTCAAVLVGMRWGPGGVAWAVAISSSAMVIPCWLAMTRGGPLTLRGLVGAAWRPAFASLAGGGAMLTLAFAADSAASLRLVLGLGVFISVFVTTWLVLPGGVTVAASMARNVRAFRRIA